jgi:hypothetical protein
VSVRRSAPVLYKGRQRELGSRSGSGEESEQGRHGRCPFWNGREGGGDTGVGDGAHRQDSVFSCVISRLIQIVFFCL